MADAKRKKLDLSGLDGLGDVMTGDAASRARNYRDIPRDRIAPDPDQPRKSFHDDSLKELAQSIEDGGIITPIVVRSDPGRDGHFILIAGERRWRASALAKLDTLPAIIRDDWRDADALLENLQREDLSALDTANAVTRLLADGQMKSADLARQLGKNKDWVSLYKQLSEADPILKRLYEVGVLGDARAVVELARAQRKNGEPVARYIETLDRQAEPVTRRDLNERLQMIDAEVNAPVVDPQPPKTTNQNDSLSNGSNSEAGQGKRGTTSSPAEREAPPSVPTTSQSPAIEQGAREGSPTGSGSSSVSTEDDAVSTADATLRTMPDLHVRVSWGEGVDEQFGIILGVSEKDPNRAVIQCDDVTHPIEVPLDQLAIRQISYGHV